MKRRQEAEPINEAIIRKTIGMKPTPIMLWDLTELIGGNDQTKSNLGSGDEPER